MKSRQQPLTSFPQDDRTTATINVRLPQNLKTGGEAVLEREGVSVSDAVRRLYEFLEKQQVIPECLKTENPGSLQNQIAEKRGLLRNLVGVLPADISLEQIRDERLEKHLRSGVQ